MTTKPITILRQEFIDKITAEVNACGLPMFVVEPIIKDLLSAVSSAARQQYELDVKQYEQQLYLEQKD